MEDLSSTSFILIVVIIFIAGTLSAAGGIGGGGVIVPILLVVGKFSFQKASVLSLCCVLGNHVAQSSINWSRHHPLIKQRPLIYWDAILVLLPPILGGSNIGVIISKISPDTVLEIIAMIVLLYAIFKTTKKARAYYLHEIDPTGTMKYQKFIMTGNADTRITEPTTISTNSVLYYPHFLPQMAGVTHQSLDDKIESHFDHSKRSNRFQYNMDSASDSEQDEVSIMSGFLSDSGSRPDTYTTDDAILPHLSTNSSSPFPMIFPWVSVRGITAVWLYYVGMFVAIQLLTHGSCSSLYFGLLASIYPILLIIVYFSVHYVAKKQQIEGQFSLSQGDLDFRHIPYLMPCITFVVGILCSLLGIGGGELMGPLLLTYHVLPQVSTATTSMLSLLTTANNIVHYGIMGKMLCLFLSLLPNAVILSFYLSFL